MDTRHNRNPKVLGAMLGAVLLLAAFLAMWLSPQLGSAKVQSNVGYSISAAPLTEQPYISVRGTGIIAARPDVLNVQIGAQVENASLSDAQWDANTKINAAMKLLAEGGVADRDVSTARLAIEPLIVYENGKPPRQMGYRVIHLLNVKFRDIAKSGKLIDSVVAAGANKLQSLSFGFSDPTALLKAARDAALADAKQKAQQFATQGGVGLGLPIIMQDAGANVPVGTKAAGDFFDSGASQNSPPTQIAPGEQEVRVEVSVVYAIK